MIALFYEKLPFPLVFLAGAVLVSVFMTTLKKYFSFSQRLFLLTIALIPSSFLSIIGTSYGDLPVSWFNLAVGLLALIVIARRQVVKWFLVILLLFTCFALVSIMQVENQFSAVKQIVNILMFMTSFMIGVYFLKREWSENFVRAAKIIYAQTAVIFGLTVIVQKMFIDATGEVIGRHGEYALERMSYAGLMSDFSFASLYIATGCIAALFVYSEKNSKFLSFIVAEAILIYSLLIVNARTGLFALIVATALGVLMGLIRGSKKAFIVGIIATVVIIFSATFIYESRGEQSLTDGSSRDDEYSKGIEVFLEHPVLGIGFGDQNFQKYLGDRPLPHNFFIQYLMQAGILGLVIILLGFLLLFRLPIWHDQGLFLMLVAALFGSMVVPDILNSRYLLVIVVMIIAACGMRLDDTKKVRAYA